MGKHSNSPAHRGRPQKRRKNLNEQPRSDWVSQPEYQRLRQSALDPASSSASVKSSAAFARQWIRGETLEDRREAPVPEQVTIVEAQILISQPTEASSSASNAAPAVEFVSTLDLLNNADRVRSQRQPRAQAKARVDDSENSFEKDTASKLFYEDRLPSPAFARKASTKSKTKVTPQSSPVSGSKRAQHASSSSSNTPNSRRSQIDTDEELAFQDYLENVYGQMQSDDDDDDDVDVDDDESDTDKYDPMAVLYNARQGRNGEYLYPDEDEDEDDEPSIDPIEKILDDQADATITDMVVDKANELVDNSGKKAKKSRARARQSDPYNALISDIEQLLSRGGLTSDLDQVDAEQMSKVVKLAMLGPNSHDHRGYTKNDMSEEEDDDDDDDEDDEPDDDEDMDHFVVAISDDSDLTDDDDDDGLTPGKKDRFNAVLNGSFKQTPPGLRARLKQKRTAFSFKDSDSDNEADKMPSFISLSQKSPSNRRPPKHEKRNQRKQSQSDHGEFDPTARVRLMATNMRTFVLDNTLFEKSIASDRSNPRHRSQLNGLAQMHGLIATTVGSGRKQYTILTKTPSSTVPNSEAMARFLQRAEEQIMGLDKPRKQKKQPSHQSPKTTPRKSPSNRTINRDSFTLQVGSLVGANAPEISETNIGNRLLRGMGWVPGAGLGATGSGITQPIEASILPKRRGLGA